MSKGLEAVTRIRQLRQEYASKMPSIEEDLSIIEKELKALEIIKNDTHILNDEGVERIVIPFYDNIYTPKEEFDLLKEVLKND